MVLEIPVAVRRSLPPEYCQPPPAALLISLEKAGGMSVSGKRYDIGGVDTGGGVGIEVGDVARASECGGTGIKTLERQGVGAGVDAKMDGLVGAPGLEHFVRA